MIDCIGEFEHALVRDGLFAHQRLIRGGRLQILGLTLPGELVLTSSLDGAHDDQLFCLADGSVEIITAGAVDSDSFRSAQTSQMRWAQNQIVRLGRMTAEERLAHFFLELSERMAGSSGEPSAAFALPLTQEHLGGLLGLTAVHVNRTLQSMRAARLVRFVNKTLEILDRETLAGIAPAAV